MCVCADERTLMSIWQTDATWHACVRINANLWIKGMKKMGCAFYKIQPITAHQWQSHRRRWLTEENSGTLLLRSRWFNTPDFKDTEWTIRLTDGKPLMLLMTCEHYLPTSSIGFYFSEVAFSKLRRLNRVLNSVLFQYQLWLRCFS